MKDITKHYTNGTVTIVWKPSLCIHSTICWKKATGLPAVFNPSERPWIKPEGATTEAIIAQVEQCPSGALSYFRTDTGDSPEQIETTLAVEVAKNGPLLVYGNITVKHKNGATEQKHKVTAFCRCGMSANKPYCDGSHISNGFVDE